MTRTDITSRQIPTVRQAAGNPLLVTLARAAKAAESGRTVFAFASHGGYRIDTTAPAGTFYEFNADGSRWLVEA